MAISFIASNGGNAAASLTGLGIQAGDLILVNAYKNSATSPALISGYTNILNTSGNSNSQRVMYKWATGTETTTGTSTNSSALSVAIYRGVGAIGASSSATKAANLNADVLALTLQDNSGTSWRVSCLGSRQVANQGTPAAGPTTNRRYQAGTLAMSSIWDTNTGVTTATATTSSNNTSVVSSSVSVELRANQPITNITDNFSTGTTVDSAKWDNWGGANVTVSGGTARIDRGTVNPSYFGFETKAGIGYSLIGSRAYVQLVAQGSPDANYTVYPIELTMNDTNQVYWFIRNSVAGCYKVVNGTYTQVGTTVAHTDGNWYSIREASGTTYWEYSTDGSNWTSHHSETNPIPLTTLNIVIFTEILATLASSIAQVDNVNTGFGGGGTTGQVKVWNGSSFVAKPVKVWNGSSWVVKPLKRWNGSSWITTPY